MLYSWKIYKSSILYNQCGYFQGMDIIETLNPSAFSDYLKRYSNTICGRHPIGVMLQVNEYFTIFCLQFFVFFSLLKLLYLLLLQAVNNLQCRGYRMSFKFLKYAQSSQCFNMSDSSVSYASGSLIFEWIFKTTSRSCTWRTQIHFKFWTIIIEWIIIMNCIAAFHIFCFQNKLRPLMYEFVRNECYYSIKWSVFVQNTMK